MYDKEKKDEKKKMKIVAFLWDKRERKPFQYIEYKTFSILVIT